MFLRPGICNNMSKISELLLRTSFVLAWTQGFNIRLKQSNIVSFICVPHSLPEKFIITLTFVTETRRWFSVLHCQYVYSENAATSHAHYYGKKGVVLGYHFI
jgi:hypothetical protein